MNKSIIMGHLACAATYIIFGINIVTCRDIATEGGLSPMVLFTMRALFAGALFWLVSLFVPERVNRSDLLKIAGAGVLGIFLPQLTFLFAITMTTPVDLSVTNSITPIITMFAAAFFAKEPITWKKAIGVAVSFGGVIWLILQSVAMGGGAGATQPAGILLCIANSTVFALYLATCRPLTEKYSSVTMMKWMFLVAFLLSLPFTIPQLPATDFGAVSTKVWLEVGFLILFATFIAYFLIPIGQKRIRPTLVSMYGYMQPIIATSAAIATGMDSLTLTKATAAILVFAGVYIVNQSKARER
ncbi:MAG: DMT family transporter [Bacteroidales bacterium]|nr:DMT family transporter [Bacteroidales bacterium]